jgi:glycosyltransferase involved in cell wall biosynthesis
MKVLVVANHNPGYFSAFIVEQMNELKKQGIQIETYGIVGKGLWGYLRNVSGIKRKIREYGPDIIHAHYGLSGLCANLQRQVPVITTYHGSDIHSGGWILMLSQLAMRLSVFNIFVSSKLLQQSEYCKTNYCVQPCGVNLDMIHEMPRLEARKKLGIDPQLKIGLFAGAFNNSIKNYPLAKAAVEKLQGVRLIELKGYNRKEVNLLMNACNFQLTTSHREAGPLVVKEAMACGTPVVSVDVGDVKEVMGDTEGCYIAERTPEIIARKIEQALAFQGKTKGRQRIMSLKLDNVEIAKKIIDIYHYALK